MFVIFYSSTRKWWIECFSISNFPSSKLSVKEEVDDGIHYYFIPCKRSEIIKFEIRHPNLPVVSRIKNIDQFERVVYYSCKENAVTFVYR